MHIHECQCHGALAHPARLRMLAVACRDVSLSPNYFGQTCCNMVEWFWWDSSLIFDNHLISFSALTLLVWSSGLQKIIPEMTYYVLSGTLNPRLSSFSAFSCIWSYLKALRCGMHTHHLNDHSAAELELCGCSYWVFFICFAHSIVKAKNFSYHPRQCSVKFSLDVHCVQSASS